jgi:chromate transport protein ChrA
VTTGWVTSEAFLAGYGLAQAVPGPLFTFAAYLGAAMGPAPNGALGAAIALIAVFLPGILLVYGMLPFWDALRSRPLAQAAMRGANAAVVGILAAARYDPVWTSAVLSSRDFVLALAGFLLLAVWKASSWAVVVLLERLACSLASFERAGPACCFEHVAPPTSAKAISALSRGASREVGRERPLPDRRAMSASGAVLPGSTETTVGGFRFPQPKSTKTPLHIEAGFHVHRPLSGG